MARINIEDKLWTDPRFEFLIFTLKNELEAIGMIVKAFRIAQKFWMKDQGLIPKSIWDSYGFGALIDCDLAEHRDGGIYVRGVSEQNEWLIKKQAAGKKSAEVRLAQFGSNQPQKPEQCSSSVRNTSRTVFDPLEPPTPTPTPTQNTFTEIAAALPATSKKLARVKKPKDPAKGSATWEAYARAFEERHKVPPLRDAKANAVCAKLVDNLGAEKAPEIARYYASREEPYLMQRKHPLGLLLSDCQKYAIEYAQTLAGSGLRQYTNDWGL